MEGRSLQTFICLFSLLTGVASQQGIGAPSFATMPPQLVEFSNMTGTRIPCSANPQPQSSNVTWIGSDGSPLKIISGLREVLPDGTLVLPPFKAEYFRQDVHVTFYKCALSSSVGTIVSNDVVVKAVVLQPYDVYVYDVFTMRGSTAVMKCHVPKVISQYVTVSSWIKNSAQTVSNSAMAQDSRFNVIPSGELYIKDVSSSDAGSTFDCVATNRLTGEVKKSITSGKLFVTDPRGNVSPKITFHRKTITANVGDVALLPCEAQAHPMPNIRWFRNSNDDQGTELSIQERYSLVSGSLLVKNLQKTDSGTYTCTASNVAGSVNVDVQLIVPEPVLVNIEPTKLIVDNGKSAVLTCKIIGSTASAIVWMKDGQPLSKLPAVEMPSNTTVRISSVSSEHKGIYQCLVKRNAQQGFATAVLTLGDSPPVLASGFKEITIQPGTLITHLKCIFSGSPTPEVKWFLDGQVVPSSLVPTETVDENDKIVSTLTIRNVKSDESGMYSCRAINKAGEANHSARVNVYGNLRSRQRTKVTGVSGETVVLNCPFSGYPFTRIEWEKDNEALPSILRQQIIQGDNLMIQGVHRVSDSGTYTCNVHHDGQVVRSEVELIVMVPPKLAPFSFQDELVREGMRGRLQCVVLEGDLPIKLMWLKDGHPIASSLGVTIREIDEFSSILTISFISPRHNGNYTCLAKNPAATVTFTTPLSVNVPPQILPFAFQDDQFFKGMRAHIICAVSQGDMPLLFHWLKDGQPIPTSLGVVTRSYDGHANSLSIESVSSGHTGNYTCVVSNAASTVEHTAQLLVHVAPKIIPFSFQESGVIEGVLARVSCVVYQGDLPIEITWLKDGQSLSSFRGIVVRAIDDYSSILTIENSASQHAGNYSCVAKNAATSVSYSAQLKVNVPPKWLIEPKAVTAKSGQTVYLHCKADGLPEPTITWMWTKDSRSGRSAIVPTADVLIMRNGSIILQRITKEKEGIYFCSASNGVGQSLSKSVAVQILAPPIFQEKQIDVTGKKGYNLTLTCAVNGDEPINFVWSMGKNIFINPRKDSRYKVKDGKIINEAKVTSELTVIWLDRKDSGLYTCQAENEFGKDEMKFNVTIQDLPDAPVLNSVKEGDRSASLSWELSFNGNSPVTKYLIQYKKQLDNWHTRTLNITIPGFETSAVVPGLQPATEYHFRVAAQNGIGLSAFSNVLAGTSEEDVPTGAPLNVEVESTDQHTLRVTWKPPPKNLWNGAIRGYEIGYKEEKSPDGFTFRNLEVPEDYTEDLIYQLPDLKMFTQYSIIVQACNTKGKGPSSQPIVAMTSEDVPSKPPQGIRCSALSSKSIYILWDPPTAESVNGIIRGYKVLYKPVSEWYDSAVRTKTSPSAKITLQELEVNTNYTIQTLAFTKVGDGVKSSPIYCKTHEDVPESPQEIKVLPSSSDSVVVAWKSPKNSNGGITKYNVYYKPLEQGQETNPASDGNDAVALMTEQVSPDASSHTSRSDNQFLEVKGLKKNKKYAFWVTASSIIGEGPSSKITAQTVADSTVPAKSASFDGTLQTPWKKDVVLPCKAVGVPVPQKKWMIGDRPLEVVGRNIILSDGTLLINKVSSEDSGNYTCVVYNEHGKDNVKYALVVQVPPAAPLLDVVSKHRSSIQLQWKAGPNGGDKVKGYILHFRPEAGPWESKELSPDHHIYTLDGLVCGSTYQMYLEAFNSIGTGPPCDIITVATEGSELANPSKDSVIREGSTYITIHLDAWPSTGCPIETFHVEYKPLHSYDWNLVSDSIRPSQKKLVIPGLDAASWYSLRITAEMNGKNNVVEYRFATLTLSGGTIPPPEIRLEQSPDPVYLFYLDPYIFIPSVALLIVVIIASVVICVCVKRKNGSMGSPSDSDTTINTWSRTMRQGSHGNSQYPTMRHRSSKDPNPYATAQLPDCILQHPYSDAFLGHSSQPQAWMGTLTRHPTHLSQGNPGMQHGFQSEFMQQAPNDNELMQETTFVFPTSNQARFTPSKGNTRPDEDYDQPPVGI